MAGISVTYFVRSGVVKPRLRVDLLSDVHTQSGHTNRQGAALCQFLAGAALLRANSQVRVYCQRDARHDEGCETW